MVSSFHEEDAGAMPLFGQGFRKKSPVAGEFARQALLNRLDLNKTAR
jgi:hypothetical protein